MKLVINKCFGGFSLSPKAVKRLAELNGKECFFFETNFETRSHIPIDMPEQRIFFSAYSVPNPDEVAGSTADFYSWTDQERRESNARWQAITLDSSPSNRADAKLVQVVTELGDEASGSCAKLEIVEIPDGVDYEISEYDGKERVEERHRSWS